MKSTGLIFIVILFMAVAMEASVLSELAESMKPGTWAELKTNGFTANLLEMGMDGSHIFQYCDGMTWDPVSEQLLFVGNPHNPYDAPGKFICYAAATNAWRVEPKNFSVFWHAYDHNAINPTRREFYHRHNDNVFRYKIDSKSWGQLPNLPNGSTCCGALEWFPEIDRLVFVGGRETSGSIALFNFSTNQWTIHSYRPALGTYHFYAEYNPVHKVLIFGGGNGSASVYKMDRNGAVTRLKDSPLGNLGPSHSTLTVDPASGKYIALGNNGTYYEFDVVNDTWKSLGNWKTHLNGSYVGAGHLPATPVSSHGVVLFAYYSWDNSKVVLYKHSESTTVQEAAGFSNDNLSVRVSPNPFNSRIKIAVSCQLSAVSNFSLKIFDINGKMVKDFSSIYLPSGRRGIPFTSYLQAKGLSPGMYLLKAKIGKQTVTKKLFLMK
jgi:hypothetical protein